MTLLDAYALVALLTGESTARRVRELIGAGDAGVTAVNLAETADVLRRRYGIEPRRVHQTLAALTDRLLLVVAVEEPVALRAAELRAEHYHRTRRPLSLADCILLAGAGPEDRVATADGPILETAERAEIETVALG